MEGVWCGVCCGVLWCGVVWRVEYSWCNGVAVTARRIFAIRNFLRPEFFPSGIFAVRKFCGREFSPCGTSVVYTCVSTIHRLECKRLYANLFLFSILGTIIGQMIRGL